MPQINMTELMAQFPNYMDVNRTKADVMAVTRQVGTLTPLRGSLILNNGTECVLLMLRGTVAMFYRGAQYNIPVEIFVTEQYPLAPPMVYVRPTPGMALKPGHKHVDNAGVVYLPYLHEWQGATSNLVNLCAQVSKIFGGEPPVYAKRSDSPSRVGTGAGGGAGAGAAGGGGGGAMQQQQQQQHENLRDPKTEAVEALTAKLQQELQVKYRNIGTQIDAEFDTQYDLECGAALLKERAEQGEAEKKDLAKAIKDVQKTNKDLDKWLAEHKGAESIDAIGLVEASDPLSDQLLRLVAEDHSYEDTLYYLDQAILVQEGDQKMSCSDFVKEIRQLLRKQFMCRALINKVEIKQREAQGFVNMARGSR